MDEREGLMKELDDIQTHQDLQDKRDNELLSRLRALERAVFDGRDGGCFSE